MISDVLLIGLLYGLSKSFQSLMCIVLGTVYFIIEIYYEIILWLHPYSCAAFWSSELVVLLVATLVVQVERSVCYVSLSVCLDSYCRTKWPLPLDVWHADSRDPM